MELSVLLALKGVVEKSRRIAPVLSFDNELYDLKRPMTKMSQMYSFC